MAVNIHIENGLTGTPMEESCSPVSAGSTDDLALYSKTISAFVVVLCAVLASGYVSLRRAIKAVHADLVKTRGAGARDRASAIPANEAEPIRPDVMGSEMLDQDVPDQSDTEQAGRPSVWRELRLVTVAWLGESLTAVTAAATGAISGATPEAEAEEILPMA